MILPALVLLACLAVQLEAQDAELEYEYGLTGTYRDSEGVEVTRVEDLLAFNWKDKLPDARLSGTDFRARWRGYVLIRSVGDYRFFLHGSGAVRNG